MATTRRTTTSWAGLAATVLVALVFWWIQGDGTTDDPAPSSGPTAATTSATDPDSGLPWVAEADLPPEARDTLGAIDAGGPFPYDRDGVVFENREEILPDEDYGYYHEYTVDTPGSEDRGARRVVTGGPGEYYWTQDHYGSFERIAR